MKKTNFTKEQFLKRCATAYDAGYIDAWGLIRAKNALDLVMRLKASFVHAVAEGYGEDEKVTIWLQGFQAKLAKDLLENESQITDKILANDKEAYQAIQFLSVLAHHCQVCAEDKDAWHTRSGFCPHKGGKV